MSTREKTAGSFSVSTSESAFGLIAYARGVMDETLDLSPLLGAPRPIMAIDLGGVERVTSFGVREWIRGIGQIDAAYLCFVRCSPAVVAQFNLVSGFAGHGELISAYLPYLCPTCEKSILHLVDLRTDQSLNRGSDPPPVPCPLCGARAEFDDMPEMYLAYIRSMPPPRPPPALGRILNGPEKVREFRIRKDVAGTVTAFHLSGHLSRGAYFRRLADGLQGEVVVDLTELDGLEEDGLTGLGRFAASDGSAIFFANVPADVVVPLSRIWLNSPDCPARVLSVKIPFCCSSCKRRILIEIDRATQARLAAGAVEACGCSYPLEPATTAEAMAAVLSLPLADPPPVVSDYLCGGESLGGPAGRKLILGKYRIEKKIGRGGEGEVFLARHIGPAEFEKKVVLKRIHRHRLGQHVLVEDFIREARIAARLAHRNIVQIIDFGRVGEEYVIAMEYVDGIDLSEAIRISRFLKQSWPVELCCRITSDLTAALQAAHATGVIHRDVSPSNVLIASDGTVKLTDFGVAKSRESSGGTPSGVFKGKEAYAPPEQLFSNRKADYRGDLFAAGVILYETLTLQWFSDNYERFLRGATVPQVVAEIRRDLPPAVRKILLRALALEPEERYASAHELQGDLESVLKQGQYASSSDLAAWIADLVEIKRRGRDRRAHEGSPGETAQVEAPQPIAAVEATERRVPRAGRDGEGSQ